MRATTSSPLTKQAVDQIGAIQFNFFSIFIVIHIRQKYMLRRRWVFDPPSVPKGTAGGRAGRG
jgi:hypothetical protein